MDWVLWLPMETSGGGGKAYKEMSQDGHRWVTHSFTWNSTCSFLFRDGYKIKVIARVVKRYS